MTETSNEAQAEVCVICSARAADMGKHLDWHKHLSTDAGNAGAEAAKKTLDDGFGQALMGVPR